MSFRDLLDSCSNKAGLERLRLFKELDEEIDRAQYAFSRIGFFLEWSACKYFRDVGFPFRQAGLGQLFLCFEVVEESAFGYAGDFADIIDTRGNESFTANQFAGGLDKFCPSGNRTVLRH